MPYPPTFPEALGITKFPDPTRANRRIVLLVALAIMSVVAWMWAGPILLRRHLLVEVDGPSTRDWTVEWIRRSDASVHGAYTELDDHQPEVVEIEVGPRPDAPSEPFEFGFFSLKTDADTRFDLVRLTDHDRAKGWLPNVNGPGIVYVGPGPGRLTIPVRTRTIAIGFAKSKRAGKVVVRFRGEVVELPANAPAYGSDIFVIPGGDRRPPVGTLARRLPTYDTEGVTLRWTSPAGDVLKFTNPRINFAVANHTLMTRAATIEAGSDLSNAGDGKWTVTGKGPTAKFVADDSPGPVVFALGCVGMFFALLLTTSAALMLVRVMPWVIKARATPSVLVVLLVLSTHFLVAATVPTLVTSDGMDYMDAADHLARHGSFDRFPDYKAPGLSILIAVAMRLSNHFLDAYAWMMAGITAATSLMAYWYMRARVPHAWALTAALVVGLHPSLITYETYLLRELPSAAVMMAVALGIVTIRDRLAKGQSPPWLWVLSLGLLCGAGAALRENLQVLVFLVPLVLLLPGAGPIRRRVIPAVAVGVLSAGMILPGVLSISKVYGNLSLVKPKIHYNRTLAAQSNRAHDANFSEFVTREQWLGFRNEHLKRALTDNDLMVLLNNSALVRDPAFTGPNKSDQQLRVFMEEATAREPVSFYKGSVRALVSQLGLWNIQTGSMKNVAPSEEYYSRALRGEAITSPTNFPPDTVVAINNARLSPNRERLDFLVKDNRRSIDGLEDRPLTRLFNEWFYASRALRPIAGWLFLVGVGIAVWKRDLSLIAVSGIVLLSTFGAAFVVGTPTDRFGVPFIPLIWCGAITAVYQLQLLRARTRS